MTAFPRAEDVRKGCVSYLGLLDKGRMKGLLDEIDRISDGNTLASRNKSRLEMEPNQKTDGRLVRRIYEPCSQHPSFRELPDSPPLLDAVETLLGQDIVFRS